MIRIAITAAANDAIAATLPLGSVGYETKRTDRGEVLIWLERRALDRLDALLSRERAIPRSFSGWPRLRRRDPHLGGGRPMSAVDGFRTRDITRPAPSVIIATARRQRLTLPSGKAAHPKKRGSRISLA
jgi:hypothetical protein